jgi:MYXO-CTERM domain-containing protein
LGGGIQFIGGTAIDAGGGGGGGFFGGGAGNIGGGGGGSGYIGGPGVSSASTLAGAADGQPPNTNDPNYIAGVGVTTQFGNGGPGEVVFTYTVPTASTPEPASILTGGLALLAFAGTELIRRRRSVSR